MTVSRHKRRVSTSGAMVAAVVGLGIAVVCGVVGGVAIYNTKDGDVLGAGTPEDRFPETPTGLLAVVDDDGGLSSVAVFALRPDGDGHSGGSVIPVPVNADLSGGFGEVRLPLDAGLTSTTPEAVAREVSALLGLSLDASAVVTEAELAELFAPLGPVTVDLPDHLSDAQGATIALAGPQTLDGAGLAAVLAGDGAGNGSLDDYDIDSAVWRGIGDAIGSGLEVAATGDSEPAVAGGSDVDLAVPAPTLATLLRALTSGPVEVASLHARPITDIAENPDGIDVVSLDRPEVVTLFAHVAPSRLAAPNPGYNLRVRSPFGDDQLPEGLSRYDLSYAATAALLGLETNVLSIDTTAGEADAVTVVEVGDDSLIAAAESLSSIFGPVEVRVAERRIAGIDAVVTLGTEYVPLVVASSVQLGAPDSSTPTTPSTGAPG
jgi:hypothetical protein